MEHRAPGGPRGPGGVHDRVRVALIQDHHDQLVVEFHFRDGAVRRGIVSQICQGASSSYTFDGDRQHDAIPRDVDFQLPFRAFHDLPGAVPHGHGADHRFFRGLQTVQTQLFPAGGALAQQGQDQLDLVALQQGGHLVFPVPVQNGDEKIQLHLRPPPTAR